MNLSELLINLIFPLTAINLHKPMTVLLLAFLMIILNDRYYEIASGENDHFYKVILHEYDESDELGEAVYGNSAW